MSTEYGEEPRVRVLIIEHNERISNLLKDAFSSDAVVADIVESAEQALQALDRTRYEQILLELTLPHADALTAAVWRTHDRTASAAYAEETSSAGLTEAALRHEWNLARLEREYIRAVLERTHGHRGRAAEILGVDRRTLYRKLRHTGHKAGEAH